ncbi:MAG: ABC transporter permease [Campylobacteraceae bacterium]
MKQKDISSFLIRKYLRFEKSQPFITVSAILAFLGVAIGLMVLMVAMAIMNGFSKEFERKLFTMNYPLTIFPFGQSSVTQDDVDYLSSAFKNLKFSPYIQSQVVLKRGQKLEGAMLFGVDFKRERQLNSVIDAALGNKTDLSEFGILAGKGIKDAMFLDTGDKMTLIFTQGDPGGLSLIPKMKRFTYEESFNSGLVAYDRAYMFTPIEGLAKVLNYEKNVYDGIRIFSSNPMKDINSIKEKLPAHLGVIGWWQQNENFFSALELEKYALFIVLMLIILVAALNVMSSLLMTVMNRRQEIALLLSLGTKPKDIKKTFFGLGMTIGCSGAVFGIILGAIVLFFLGNFDIIKLPADVYGSSKLPLELSIKDFGLIVIGALGIVALSSYYPAKKATEVDILQTLRNE